MNAPRVQDAFGNFGGADYRPSMTPREKAMFAEMAGVEKILADALGLDERARFDQTITTLAVAAAEFIAEQRTQRPDLDTHSIRVTAEQWANKIEHWLANGNDAGHSPDYEAGFRDGWTHSANILRSLFAGVADNLAVEGMPGSAPVQVPAQPMPGPQGPPPRALPQTGPIPVVPKA